MREVCDCCKKEKPWIKTTAYQGECIGSTEIHLCSKCYKNNLQVESKSIMKPQELGYMRRNHERY